MVENFDLSANQLWITTTDDTFDSGNTPAIDFLQSRNRNLRVVCIGFPESGSVDLACWHSRDADTVDRATFATLGNQFVASETRPAISDLFLSSVARHVDFVSMEG